jgi:hypothetical protein
MEALLILGSAHESCHCHSSPSPVLFSGAGGICVPCFVQEAMYHGSSIPV